MIPKRKGLGKSKLSKKDELLTNTETLIDTPVDNTSLTSSTINAITNDDLEDIDIDMDSHPKTPNQANDQSFHLLSKTDNEAPETSISTSTDADGSNLALSDQSRSDDIVTDSKYINNNSSTDTTKTDPWASVDKGTFAGIIATLFGFFFAINVIYPFVVFMVADFYPSLNESQLGYYVGYVESSFFLGSLFAGVIWARLADRFGRRPIVISGLIGGTACAVTFGMSINYWMALIIRFSWGVLDGNVTVVKTILGEIATPETQARLYSILGLMSGLGRLCGSLAGGWLSNVDIGHIKFFKQFPYALPCMIAGISCIVALFIAIFFLKETKHELVIMNRKNKKQKKGFRNIVDDIEPNDEDDQLTEIEMEKIPMEENGMNNELENDDDNSGDDSGDNSGDSSDSDKQNLSAWQVFRVHDVWVSTGFYLMLAFVATAYNATFAIWVVTSKDEYGFGWKAENIGTVFAICGPIYTLWQMFVYPKIVKKVGFVRLCKICMAMYGIMSIFQPHLAIFRHLSETPLFIIVTTYVAIGFLFRVSMFTCLFAIINNSSHSKDRATANGIGQSMASLGRILAPTLLCNIFAWSANKDHIWPFNYVLAFYIQGAVGVFASLWLNFLLPTDFESKIGKHNKNITKKFEKIEKQKLKMENIDNINDKIRQKRLNKNDNKNASMISIESNDSIDGIDANDPRVRINYGIKAMDSQFGLILPKTPSQSLSNLTSTLTSEKRLLQDNVIIDDENGTLFEENQDKQKGIKKILNIHKGKRKKLKY